ncbi:MAG: hypothetical protein R2809_10785 [Flavobacteriales bacterium]
MNYISKYAMLLLVTAFFISCGDQPKEETVSKPSFKNKVKGVNLVGNDHPLDIISIIELYNIHANAVGLGVQAIFDMENDTLKWNTDAMDWCYTNEGLQRTIELSKEKKLFVTLQPFLKFEGMDSTTTPEQFLEKLDKHGDAYRQFILEYAKMSEENRLPVFSIGTVLDEWVMLRPEYWKNLIQEVRHLYHGDVIYTCQFRNEERVQLWKDLNYIGIMALDEAPDSARYAALGRFSEEMNKEVIFTFWGYNESDEKVQAQKIEQFFNDVYKQDWSLGGYLWKWEVVNEEIDLDSEYYSPQNRTAQKTIESYWK